MDIDIDDFLKYIPVVGDEFCLVKTTSIVRASAPTAIETKVNSVGRKYFTLEGYPNYKFYIDGKKIHESVKSFPTNYKLYPSKVVYNNEVEALRLIDLICVATKKCSSDSENSILKTPLTDIQKACELLNIKTTKSLS